MLYQFDQDVQTIAEKPETRLVAAPAESIEGVFHEEPLASEVDLELQCPVDPIEELGTNIPAAHSSVSPVSGETTTSEPTDEQLMDRIAMKEDAALVALYRRHMPLLRTIVARVINNDADVDDLIQQIFLEVWYQADRYDVAKGKALGWIVTLARRRAIDKLRKRQAYSRVEERLRVEVEHEAEQTPSGQSADMDAIHSDRSEILKRILSALPEPQQEALQLAFYRGMSQREIAAHTGIPLGTIKTRIELAVRKVRSALLAMGGASEWEFCHH